MKHGRSAMLHEFFCSCVSIDIICNAVTLVEEIIILLEDPRFEQTILLGKFNISTQFRATDQQSFVFNALSLKCVHMA